MGTTMSDTTIRSHFGKKLKIGYRGNGTVQIECGPDHDNTGNHVRIYKLDELKAALGIDELGCGCDEADDNLAAAIRRAEDAEHEVSELRGELAEAVMYDSATLTKVREGLRAAGLQWDTITDAINQMQNRGILFRERPKPPFELPTEAGAEFWADREGEGHLFETIEASTGWLYVEVGAAYAYTAEEVMDIFTDHRLSGVEA